VVEPHGVYRPETLRAALGLSASTVRREVRLGRLKVARRGGKYYLLGRWILEWVEGGLVERRPTAAQK
jgi:hypothetical protein